MIRKLMNFQNIQLVWLMRWTLLLPAMPRDQAEADQLAPSHLDGPHHRAAISTAPLCEVRRSIALGQAVATGRRAGQAAGAQGMTYATRL